MKYSRWLKTENLFFVFAFIFLNALAAIAGPSRTTYQAKIIKPDGYPLESVSVNFKFTVLDPAGACILYSETYSSVNMASTGGLISFSLGSGVRVYPVSATTFENVFSNSTPNLSCDAGGPPDYSPAATDVRKLVMQFHDGNGWQTLPAMSINAVPYAMYANDADKLNGKTDADFVQVSTLPMTCGVSEALRFNGAAFSCIAVGDGGTTVTSGSVITALGYTPADGASFTTLSSTVSSVSSTVSGFSSTVSNLSGTVSGISNTVAGLSASMSAIISSQWTTNASDIFYTSGRVGVGTSAPSAAFDVGGWPEAPANLSGTNSNFTGNIYVGNSGVSVPRTRLSANVNGGFMQWNRMLTTSGAAQMDATKPSFNFEMNGTTDRFAFQRAASGSSTLVDLMTIAGSGHVGIGTATPMSPLEIAIATGSAHINLQGTDNSGASVRYFSKRGSTSQTLGSSNPAGDNKGWSVGSIGDQNAASTRRNNFEASYWSGTAWSTPFVVTASGSVGIGTTTPVTKLDVAGGLRIGAEAASCTAGFAGTLRYNAGVVEYCNGTSWAAFGVSGAGILAINGLASGSQTFAFGATGNSPNVSSVGSVHTFNFPFASVGTTTAGVISNADYLNFSNKVNATSASVISVLGYTPADAVSVTTLSSTVNSVSSSVSSLTNAMAASFAAVVNSQWITSATSIYYNAGNVGIGNTTPSAKLHLSSANNLGVTEMLRLSNSGGNASGDGQKITFYSDVQNAYIEGVRDSSGGPTMSLRLGVYASEVMRLTQTRFVGIRTTTPSYPLEVSGITNADQFYADDGSQTNPAYTFANAPGVGFYNLAGNMLFTTGGSPRFGMDSSAVYGIGSAGWRLNYTNTEANPAITVGAVTDTGIWGPSSKNLAISTSGVERLRVTSAGAVGIGTTTPTAKLNLAAGTTSIAPFKLTSGSLLTAAQAGAIEYNGFDLYFTDGAGVRRALATGSTPSTIDDASFINASGNITMTPVGSVVVSSTTASTNSQTGALIVKGGLGVAGNIYSSGTIITTSDIQGSVITATSATVTPYIYGSIVSGGSLRLESTTHANKGNTIINALGGNVGIGTTAPRQKLDVVGVAESASGTAPKGAFVVGAASTNGVLNMGVDNPGTFYSWIQSRHASSANYYNLSLNPQGGNVGIGTATPSALLAISASTNGDAELLLEADTDDSEEGDNPFIHFVQDSALIHGYLGFSGNANQAFNLTINDVSSNSLVMNSASSPIFLATSNTARLSIATGGNVGIGTANPSGILDISGTEASDEKRLVFSASDNSDRFYITTDLEASTSSDRLGFRSLTADNILLMTGAGRVGLGTDSPQVKLTVDDSNGTVSSPYVTSTDKLAVINSGSAVIQVTTPNTQTGGIYFSDPESRDPGGIAYSHLSDAMVFRANGSTRMTISASGHVGVGTGSPASNLHVFAPDSAIAELAVTGSAQGSGVLYVGQSPTFGAGMLYNGDDAPDQLGTSDDVVFFRRDTGVDHEVFKYRYNSSNVTFTGNIGIGTSSPAVRFDLGTASANTTTAILARAADPNFRMEAVTGVATNVNGDLIGKLGIRYATSGADTALLKFYRGTTSYDGAVAITTSGTDRFIVKGDGDVGIGTSAPAYRLDVSGGVRVLSSNGSNFWSERPDSEYDIQQAAGSTKRSFSIHPSTTGGDVVNFYANNAGSYVQALAIKNVTGRVGILNSNPLYPLAVGGDVSIAAGANLRFDATVVCTSAGCTSSSDKRLKENIQPLDFSLEKLLSLNAVQYDWKDKAKFGDKHQIGLIAQDLEKVYPEVVYTDKDSGFKAVAYDKLVAPIIEALKVFNKRIAQLFDRTEKNAREIASVKEENAALKARVEKSEKENAELKQRLDRIEKVLNSK